MPERDYENVDGEIRAHLIDDLFDLKSFASTVTPNDKRGAGRHQYSNTNLITQKILKTSPYMVLERLYAIY